MLRLTLVFIAVWLAYGLPSASASPLECPGKLGVSRTISIDTTGGPLHGSLQYKTESLLKPGEVVLTFDDGPLRSVTRKVLAALKDHCTKATFFMVGLMAVSDPAMVREVAAAGHTVASHTWSHKNLNKWSSNRGKGEIELGISAIEQALGRPIAPFFRFPYLAAPKSMVAYNQQRDIAVFSIDIDSRDFRTRSGSKMSYTVMRHLKHRGKGIILMHDIQVSTARGIQQLLDELYDKGYKVVHLEAANTVATLPEYDQQAAGLHAKRRYAATVRPVNSGAEKVRVKPKKKKIRRRPVKRYKADDDDDWIRQILGN